MSNRWLAFGRTTASAATEITARLVQPESGFMRLATWALALFIAYQAWDYFAPRKAPISPSLQAVAARVIPQAVQDLRVAGVGGKSVALLQLSGDRSDTLTRQLRDAIETNNIVDLQDRTIFEKLADLFRMKQSGYGTFDTAVTRGEKLDAQAVLFGVVHAFDSDDTGSARLDLELHLADVPQKKVLLSKRYSDTIGGGILSPTALTGGINRIGFVNRFLGWAVIVLLLPVFTINFIRAMVKKESNAANAFALCIYTLVDALLAYLLLGVNAASALSILIFLVIVGVVLIYNVSVMTFAVRLER